MRRTSTRKSASQKSAAVSLDSSVASDLLRSAPGKAVSKEMERIDQLFYAYADRSSNLIEKMKSERQGYFSLEEWRRGLKALRADTIGKIKKALPELEKEVRRQQNFLDFYSYAFRYCLTEDKQKSIDIESACELLEIVLGSQFRPQVDKLIAYLKSQHDYKVINMDQWIGFLRFCNEINFPSVDNYDSALAWPLILDNFVEWMLEKRR